MSNDLALPAVLSVYQITIPFNCLIDSLRYNLHLINYTHFSYID